MEEIKKLRQDNQDERNSQPVAGQMNYFIAGFVILVMVVAGYFLISFLNERRAGEIVILEGIQVCVPRSGEEGTTTLECALGVETDDRDYYALDFSQIEGSRRSDFSTGDRIQVVGVFTPYEEVEERFKKYEIEGSVLATSALLIEETRVKSNNKIFIDNLSVSYPGDFELVLNTQAESRENPLCSDGFDYCLYYDDSFFEDTNFGGARIGINRLNGIISPQACVEASPDGFSNSTFEVKSEARYTTSIFSNLNFDDNNSTGSLYRLAYGGNCFEFETKIIKNEFEIGNGEEEFTESDKLIIERKINEIIGSLLLDNETEVAFPEIDNSLPSV